MADDYPSGWQAGAAACQQIIIDRPPRDFRVRKTLAVDNMGFEPFMLNNVSEASSEECFYLNFTST